MTRKIVLMTAALFLLAGLAPMAHAGCGGGGGGEGRGAATQSEASTAPTGYTPGVGGTASGTTWENTVISWDHEQVSAEAEAQAQRDLEEEAQRQEVASRFDQQALDQQAEDAEYSSRPTPQAEQDAERDAERAQHIRNQLGNPDPATMAIIEHDFPTLDAQEAMIGIVTLMVNLEQQRHNLPPETYNAIHQELTGHFQDLQNAAAADRFNAAVNFGLSVTVNVGSAAVGGAPGFAIGFTYNLATGGASNAATGTAVSIGSNAVQAVVPGYAIVAPVADAYAQDQFNNAIK